MFLDFLELRITKPEAGPPAWRCVSVRSASYILGSGLNIDCGSRKSLPRANRQPPLSMFREIVRIDFGDEDRVA